jgi:hypothetical protein
MEVKTMSVCSCQLGISCQFHLIGTKLYGYCNGYFGEDYTEKVIEAVGKDWLVVRNDDGKPLFGEFSSFDKLLALVKIWNVEEYD